MSGDDRPTPTRVPRRDARNINTNLRQGIEGIVLVTGLTLLLALIGWLIAVVVAWVY